MLAEASQIVAVGEPGTWVEIVKGLPDGACNESDLRDDTIDI